jgi:AraC-like DNA-binding protein
MSEVFETKNIDLAARMLSATDTSMRIQAHDQQHRDLLTADPARETVTGIAQRWGFSDLSRFAAGYRRTYGVPPNHTLHQD